jgi:hypothetical protein
MTWSETDLAYMAGIIDGEGTISARRRKNQQGARYVDFMLSVANTDERLIRWIHERFSGSIDFRQQRQSDIHKPLWRWTTSATNGELVIVAVRPYLVIKQAQADLYLELRETIGNGYMLTDEIKAKREELVTELHRLNKRGKAV